MLECHGAIASGGRTSEDMDRGRGARFRGDGRGRSRVLARSDTRRADPRRDDAHRRDARHGRRKWTYPPTSENCWRSSPATELRRFSSAVTRSPFMAEREPTPSSWNGSALLERSPRKRIAASSRRAASSATASGATIGASPERTNAPGARHSPPAYLTTIDVGWLQFPSPVRVTPRLRNMTVAPGVSPESVVLAWRVLGMSVHVLPPSRLDSHS